MNQNKSSSFDSIFNGGFKREEMICISSPIGRMKHRAYVNLPRNKEGFGVYITEQDFSKLEARITALMANQYKDRICEYCGGRVYADGLSYNKILWRCTNCPYEKVEIEK